MGLLTRGSTGCVTNQDSGAGRSRLVSRLASFSDGSSQLYVRWMDNGQIAKLTQVTESPSGLTWSPDGRWIAFSMLVPEAPAPFVKLPAKPEGAEATRCPRRSPR